MEGRRRGSRIWRFWFWARWRVRCWERRRRGRRRAIRLGARTWLCCCLMCVYTQSRCGQQYQSYRRTFSDIGVASMRVRVLRRRDSLSATSVPYLFKVDVHVFTVGNRFGVCQQHERFTHPIFSNDVAKHHPTHVKEVSNCTWRQDEKQLAQSD